MDYDLRTLRAPRLTGTALKAFASLLENSYTSKALEGYLQREFGLEDFRRAARDESPTGHPWHANGRAPGLEIAQASCQALEQPKPTWPADGEHRPLTIQSLSQAYRSGQLSPETIAEQVLIHLETSNDGARPLRAVISHEGHDLRRQAAESAALLREGRPRSLLEGVPVAVKDEFDALPYATRVGTRFLGDQGSCREDATAVARLRAAGALIIGKANMHEVGIGVTGANPHNGPCRNPWDLDRYPGGSSSGSAAAVAAGLCPLAVGADGGGSIRIPAALCGVTGLKPTWGRISEHGAYPLCWSVAHAGPIGTSVDDVALGYILMAGPDINDHWTLHQPNVHLQDYLNNNLKGLKVGVYQSWFRDADKAVVAVAELALKALEKRGAVLRDIAVPGLEEQRVAHAVTIASEMRTALAPHLERNRDDFALDSRINLAIAGQFSAVDYLQAQRVRTRAIRTFQQVMEDVDVILTPTTASTAPPLRRDAVKLGESDMPTLSRLMRFVTPANLTGLPALSVPAGCDDSGLPVGVQLMGRPWEEHLLLRMGRVIEAATPRRRPAVHFDLLP